MSSAKKQIWLLTGSQSLSCEETLKQVAEQFQSVLAELKPNFHAPVELVWKPVVSNSNAIRREMPDASTDDISIGVMTWIHTFSPAKRGIAGLNAPFPESDRGRGKEVVGNPESHKERGPSRLDPQRERK